MSVTYTDAELRNLIEEFITQRKEDFSLRDACSYILYWAVEDGKVTDSSKLIESKELYSNDQERVKIVLDDIVADGRIVTESNQAFINAKSNKDKKNHP